MEMATQMEMVVLLSGLRDHIKRHAKKEADRGGYECVGFVARKNGATAISAASELHNHSSDPSGTFFVEPWEQWKNERTLEEAGFEIAGVYHSHPTSEARPSRSDRELALDGKLTIIYSVCYDQLEGWRKKDGELQPVQLVFVDDYKEEEDA